MDKNNNFFVVADDVYAFRNLDAVIGYFEKWDNKNSFLFDVIGNVYVFRPHLDDNINSDIVDLGQCVLEVLGQQDSEIVAKLKTSGFVPAHNLTSLVAACEYLETRFGISE